VSSVGRTGERRILHLPARWLESFLRIRNIRKFYFSLAF
jgi:hypothetical protein